ncbi:MAG: M23 family metallopeptidase [Clostridia bacterium]|nr:M23 family metallopeptidase [Clostridia bacterium]
MAEKENKVINFVKKNAYYFAFITALAVITIIVVSVVISLNNKFTQVNGGNDTVVETPDEENKDQNGENQTPEEPVVSVITFDMPTSGTIIKEYVGAGVIYNQTLGAYQGHKAIDFGGEVGADVFACYNGVVESITTSKLDGTTIVVDHLNGLKSSYNSIDVAENIEVGSIVERGEVIGYIAQNNKKEYLDGPHLHFEVFENGEKVDPNKYLVAEEK